LIVSATKNEGDDGNDWRVDHIATREPRMIQKPRTGLKRKHRRGVRTENA
jgi:hypothetical protein